MATVAVPPHPPELARTAALIFPILCNADAESRAVWQRIDELMLASFTAAGLGWFRRRISWWYLKRAMITAARAGVTLRDLEIRLRPRFKSFTEKVYRSAVQARAEIACARLTPHLVGDTLLDLGAGNGLIGAEIHRRTGMAVTLADVIDYRLTDLPLVTFAQGGELPLADGSFDTTLLYLVLHHADDPEQLLREAARVTRRRVVIMEGHAEDVITRHCNGVLDWFFNRVVQGADINVPLNYRTIAGWQAQFAANGLELVHTDVVGIDEPRAPEAHVLYVLDRR